MVLLVYQRLPAQIPGDTWIPSARGVCDCGCARYDPDCAGASGNPQAHDWSHGVPVESLKVPKTARALMIHRYP